jgi:putative transposase
LKAGETAWLGEIHSQVLQQSLKDLDSAYRHFFLRVKKGEKPGFPRFKKKGLKDSFRYPQGIKVQDGKVLDSRPTEGEVLQATVKREGEHWFVCLACEVELPDPASIPVTENRAVGIDVGLKTFAMLSDGTEIENPRFLAKALAKLRKAQRRLSRKVKGSNNRKKQAVKIARLHAGVKNCRKDFAHKSSTAIVKNHDVIAVEGLNIRRMVRNRHLSRAISDAGWRLFMQMLKYKAEWAGKHFVRIGRFVATSQTCSACGEKKPMPLDVRSYSCGNCGLVVDRDWNAGLNIRAAGLAVLNACGGAYQWRPR